MLSKKLAQNILTELELAAQAFGRFQSASQLTCPTSCGKCCFNPEVSCSPYELLPLAFYLLENNLAEDFLERAKVSLGEHCLLLKVIDKDKGKGTCSQYQFRPFVCRAFGVAARLNKKNLNELSICKTLKEQSSFDLDDLHTKLTSDVPLLEVWKKRLEVIDPELNTIEKPINEALIIMLEKLLLLNSYSTF